MVIGHGDIASVLKDREDVIFFASGVSNSQCTDYNEFKREYDLLCQQNRYSHLVYFSTLSIYYADTKYTRHKKRMEGIVQSRFATSTIVRIGNIDWGKNPNTLINYLKAHPEAERRNETRYLIDKYEFLHWMDKIRVGENDIMNLTGQIINVKEL